VPKVDVSMTPDEVRGFLAEPHTIVCATAGPRGWPHLMPLWYLPRGDELWAWTFARSQKARNLERDPRATLQAETGLSYYERRGVMFEAESEIVRDEATVRETGLAIHGRYQGDAAGELPPATVEVLERQVPKRVVVRFRPVRTVSWDHGRFPRVEALDRPVRPVGEGS
jgi:PPOX class probable F420-dependent enzyme